MRASSGNPLLPKRSWRWLEGFWRHQTRLLLTQHHMARVEAIGDVAEPGPAIRHKHVRIHLLRLFPFATPYGRNKASPLPAPWQYDQRGLRTGCADGTDEIGERITIFRHGGLSRLFSS